jgi:hypothetical protein
LPWAVGPPGAMNLGGDCVWDETRGLFWTGYGPRSDRAASVVVEDLYGVETIPLENLPTPFLFISTPPCARCPAAKSYLSQSRSQRRVSPRFVTECQPIGGSRSAPRSLSARRQCSRAGRYRRDVGLHRTATGHARWTRLSGCHSTARLLLAQWRFGILPHAPARPQSRQLRICRSR